MGQLTQDLFTCIALLNSLSDFSHLRSLITHDLSQSTASAPYTSSHLFTLLENEQRIIPSDQKRNDTIALASHAATPKHTSTMCNNCNKTGHTPNFCVAPGGGMSGKTIMQAKEAQKKERESKKKQGSAAGKYPINIKGADGKVYTAYMDSLLLEIPAIAAFADMGILPSVLDNAIEYLGWAAFDDGITLQATTSLSVKPRQANITSNEMPFLLDTRVTVHISPNAQDFHSLRKIEPQAMHGLGGTSVTAIGIGDICLHISSTQITLHNALLIPTATVRLISMRCLTLDSNFTTHFDGSSCWLTSLADHTIICGHLSSSKLYSFTLDSTPAIHAFVIHSPPDIATWHRRLGHANYRAVADMITHGLIQGVSATPRKPIPRCDSCVLGKQTRTSVPKARVHGVKEGRATRRLEKVWVDLSGPHDVVSRTGGQYIMNIVDDHSSFVWSIILKNKSDAFAALQTWE
jgi:hypothetical protein